MFYYNVQICLFFTILYDKKNKCMNLIYIHYIIVGKKCALNGQQK